MLKRVDAAASRKVLTKKKGRIVKAQWGKSLMLRKHTFTLQPASTTTFFRLPLCAFSRYLAI